MSAETKTEDYYAILEIAERFAQEGGASLEDILEALPQSVPRRTLQRRVAALVKENRLQKVGAKNQTRYVVIQPPNFPQLWPGGAFPMVLTENSPGLLAAVRKPLLERLPVGYQRKFLDAYRPNESFYLPERTRQELLFLGQASPKERPAGTYARQILSEFLLDLSWNSSRLEGNTYSLLETKKLIERSEMAPGKNQQDTQMILNHKSAIEFLVESASDVGINSFTICNLHGLLSQNLLFDPSDGGRLRHSLVKIHGTVYLPLGIPQLLEECFQQVLDTAAAIMDPFEQAFFLMVHLPYLQPFVDVNKRVSRLAANIPFIQKNLCPLSFIDVPEQAYIDGLFGVYELNQVDLLRDVFVWAYRRSSLVYSAAKENIGEPDAFKLKYRDLVAQIITHVVRTPMNVSQATAYVKAQAQEFVQKTNGEFSEAHFIDALTMELEGLHEGNIARYKIRLVEYKMWHGVWS
jgi:hypothetical protein